MRMLTIRFGLEKGDTSMDDTIEVATNFDVPEAFQWMGERVIATYEDVTSFSWSEVVVLARRLEVDTIEIISNGESFHVTDGMHNLKEFV